jgi:hypothetical protein
LTIKLWCLSGECPKRVEAAGVHWAFCFLDFSDELHPSFFFLLVMKDFKLNIDPFIYEEYSCTKTDLNNKHNINTFLRIFFPSRSVSYNNWVVLKFKSQCYERSIRTFIFSRILPFRIFSSSTIRYSGMLLKYINMYLWPDARRPMSHFDS